MLQETVPRKYITETLFSGCLSYLSSAGQLVKVVSRNSQPNCIYSWEHEHGYSLPADLVQFYQMTDGIQVTWGDQLNPLIGCMEVEPVQRIVPFEYVPQKSCSSEWFIDYSSGKVEPAHHQLPGPSFILCQNDLCSILLTYLPHGHEYWAYDRIHQSFYRITDNFTAYFRLMVTHLGILGWPCLYRLGITKESGQYSLLSAPPSLMKWLQLYAPNMAKLHQEAKCAMLRLVCSLNQGAEDWNVPLPIRQEEKESVPLSLDFVKIKEMIKSLP